jgi:hypothetical protein
MSVLVHLAACDLREFLLQLQHVLRDIREQPRRSNAPLRLLLRQYSYFCTSKASKLSTCRPRAAAPSCVSTRILLYS